MQACHGGRRPMVVVISGLNKRPTYRALTGILIAAAADALVDHYFVITSAKLIKTGLSSGFGF